MAAILVLAHGPITYGLSPDRGLHEKLARQGLVTVRFNFPYAEAGRQRPDADEALEGPTGCPGIRGRTGRVQGPGALPRGKSMGARLAAQLVAQEVGPAAWYFWATRCIPR